MENIKNILEKKDKEIFFLHKRKDITALESTLLELKHEHDSAKTDMNSVNYLLDLIAKHNIDEADSPAEDEQKNEFVKNLFQKLKFEFERLHLTPTQELKPSDIVFIKTQKSKLIAEHSRLENQIKYLDIIIGKTSVLLLNLREAFCKDLTAGYSIASVSEKLLEKFGKVIKAKYSRGRKNIIIFLEEAFSLNKIKSQGLFDLLVDSNIIQYKVDIPVLDDYYYNDEFNANYDLMALNGTWTINS